MGDKWKEEVEKLVNAVDFLEIYKKDVLRTAQTDLPYEEYLVWCAMGMTGEAGETQEVIKKFKFQGHVLKMDKLIEELGDTFFYMTALMQALDISLIDVIRMNIKKRKERYPNGFDPEKSKNRGVT